MSTNLGKSLAKVDLQIKALESAIQKDQTNLSNYFEVENKNLDFTRISLKGHTYFKKAKQDLPILDLKNYLKGNSNGFYYRDYQAETLKLNLRISTLPYQNSRIKAKIRCQGPFKFKSAWKLKNSKLGTDSFYHGKINIYQDKDLLDSIIEVNHETQNCMVSMKQKKHLYQFFLKPESKLLKQMGIDPYQIQACGNNSSSSTTSYPQFIENLGGPYSGCNMNVKNIEFLDRAFSGLDAKIQLLLGQSLSEEEVRSYRPGHQLDFSKAPKLDAIFLSYLTVRNDLSGSLILRLLKFHADRGAQVRLLSTKILTSPKDHVAFKKIQDLSPNFQIQLLESGTGPWNQGFREDIARFHRVNHVKMFTTYSKSDPLNNQVILGGRNLRDVFYFRNLPDLSDHSELVQYGVDEPAIFFNDFEYKIADPNFVEGVISQFMRHWGYQKNPYYVAPSSITYNRKTHRPSSTPSFRIRNHISYPTLDDRSAENRFVNAIDLAKKTITFVTPYFNLTKEIGAALERAKNRGVDIVVLTRINLNGDTFGGMLSEVNRTSINQLNNGITIYEYLGDANILHSKIYLFDDEFAILGSTNLNKRSFVHDSENLTYVSNPNLGALFKPVFKGYLDQSREVEKEVASKFIYRIIYKMLKDEV